jgi:hypothetical protein
MMSGYRAPRLLWQSRCRRDTSPVLRPAAWKKDISSSAEASARNELLLRRGSSRGRAPKNANVGGASVDTFFCGKQAAVTAAALW